MKEPQLIMNFSYMGMNDKNQWVRIFCHAGGLTENIVQSIAGDLLWHGITEADKAGLPVVLHVHDEIAAEVAIKNAQVALDTLQKCMTKRPPWAQDMWIGADGFITHRYTKD
jgi:DNA polymerase